MNGMTENQDMNELLSVLAIRYRVVDDHGETVMITNDRDLALFMSAMNNGEIVELKE